MRNIFFATTDQVLLANRLESLLVGLGKESGVLFAGAQIVEVSDDGQPDWGISLMVGCSRNLDTSTVEALVWHVIENNDHLVYSKHRVKVAVFRGVARSS